MKELNHEAVLKLLPDRDPFAQKGNFGRILLLCGSRGYTGAAALAAMGALRGGAGLVYLGVPESIYTIEAIKLTEAIVFPLAESEGKLSSCSVYEIEKRLAQMDVVLIGPGLGQSEGVFNAVQFVLTHFSGPVILDADGINCLAKHKDILRERTGVTILTPHEGEFERLFERKISNRNDDAVQLANDLCVIVVLKGHRTVITDGSQVFCNPTGNPGMAVGGSGDVLAGLIAALTAQGIKPLEAAACGAWLHGAAGDICEKEIGQYGMLPTDMLQVLPRLMK